jgi:chromosome segregation ATPase
VCVRVQNLMIHGVETMHFSPRFNFITGRNGAGKSRMVVAVQLALGARSNSTGRGTNMNDFVCNADTKANIEVVLYNGGHNAYKPHEYGKYFVISRFLKRTGDRKSTSSTFGLQYTDPEEDETLKKAPGKQGDLTRIRDEFLRCAHIKPDNPMVILTQQESKRMLNTQNPSALYEVFLQATNLHSLGEQFAVAKAAMEKYEDEAKELSKNIKLHEDTLRGLQERFDLASSASAIEKEVAELQQRRAVRELQDLRETASKALHTVEKYREHLAKHLELRNVLKASLEKQGEPLRLAHEELARLEAEKVAIERQVSDKLSARKAIVSREYKEMKNTLRLKESEIAARTDELKKFQSRLRAEMAKKPTSSASADGRSLEDVLAELDAVRTRMTELKDAELPRLQRQQSEAEAKKAEHLSREKEVKRRLAAALDGMKKKQEELGRLGVSKDPFAQVKKAIEACVCARVSLRRLRAHRAQARVRKHCRAFLVWLPRRSTTILVRARPAC